MEKRTIKRDEISYQRWVWLELLGFDVNKPDFGVEGYLDTLGFVPHALSLLISSPDIILQHEGVEEDAVLPPDFCSRNGQEGNEVRRRQVWTRFQLRGLIARLRESGCLVYLSCFTNCLKDRFHREWLGEHPEGMISHTTHGRREALFVLNRLRDGTLIQDYFASQLVRVCEDYGFDGWHGPDGYGPSSSIYITGFDDDFFGQFVERGGYADIPQEILDPSKDLPENLVLRRDWVWRNKRLEWITFYTDRWAEFWSTVVRKLHAIGRKTMINSAWTRDPFEAMYRYGIDYRKIAATGVDAIMVETAAGGILLGSNDRDYHYDYLAMLMLIKAYVPEVPLIFLHGIKDVEEDWDLLRHAPAMLEREVYSLANVYHLNAKGEVIRSVDGFLGCLADGVSREEWQGLQKHWNYSFGPIPQRIVGATVLWSDVWLHRYQESFAMTREPSVHQLVYQLMQRGAPLQITARMEDLGKVNGPVIVCHPQLITMEERERLLSCGNPLIVLGSNFNGWPEGEGQIVDGKSEYAMQARFYSMGEGFPKGVSEYISALPGLKLPEDLLGIEEPTRFRALPYYRPVSEEFYKTCSSWIHRISGGCQIENQRPLNLETLPPLRIGVMMMEMETGVYRLAIKNSASIYGRPIIDMGRPIKAVKVRSSFPVSTVKPEGSQFKLVVPQSGVVVCDVFTTEADSKP